LPWTPAFAGATKKVPPRARSGPTAFAEAGITPDEVDHLMIYDALCSLPGASFAHLPIYCLESLIPGTARGPTGQIHG